MPRALTHSSHAHSLRLEVGRSRLPAGVLFGGAHEPPGATREKQPVEQGLGWVHSQASLRTALSRGLGGGLPQGALL